MPPTHHRPKSVFFSSQGRTRKPDLSYLVKARNLSSKRPTVMQEKREDEARNRAIVEALPDLVFRISRDGTYLDAHAPQEEDLLVPRDQLLGRTVRDVLPAELAAEAMHYVERALETGAVQVFEYALPLPRGDVRSYEVRIASAAADEVLIIVRDITAHKQAEEALIKRTYELGERVKELDGLYAVSKLVSDPAVSLDAIFEHSAKLIPPAWQYPAITCARIVYQGRAFTTDNFRETPWRQAVDIVVAGKRAGSIEVFYLEERPAAGEELFLKEEQHLIEALGRELGNAIERKQAQEALLESEARNQAILETTVDGVITIDEQGRIASFNRAAEQIFGYKAEDVLGENIRLLMPPPYHDEHDGYLQHYLETGQRKIMGVGKEVIGRRKDGSTFPMDLAISEVNLNEQRLFTGFVRDITARREAERQTWYQATLLENVSEAIIGLDTDFVTIRSWNRAAEKIYGFAAEEVLGQSILNVLKPDLVDAGIEEDGQAFLESGYWTGEVVQRRKDGARLRVAASASVVKDRAGTVIGAVYVNRDITAQKKAEAALKALEREVLDISHREQRRIGRDLHDGLGAHLTGIAMVCRTLARRAEKGKTVSQEELNNVANLVQEGITEARRLARGLNPVKLEREGLTSALHELASMIQTRSGVPCTFASEKNLPDLDGEITTQLYRIAQEAAHNALKHARPGTVSIRLGREDDHLVLSVQDDGIGLPPDHPTSEGMGLRVMQYRARMIGATVDVRSAPGSGTLMRCALPYREAALSDVTTP